MNWIVPPDAALEQAQMPQKAFGRSKIEQMVDIVSLAFRLLCRIRMSISSHISALFCILFPFFTKLENQSIENIHRYKKK